MNALDEHERNENEHERDENEHERSENEHERSENEHERNENEHERSENEHERSENEHERSELRGKLAHFMGIFCACPFASLRYTFCFIIFTKYHILFNLYTTINYYILSLLLHLNRN